MSVHQPVLLHAVLDGLAIKPDGVYIDGTFGRGGHSEKILEQLSERGRLIAIDKDPQAIAAADKKFSDDGRFTIVHDSFSAIKAVSEDQDVLGCVDGILLDLGVSSPQLDDAARGFSFLKAGPLDMRMNPNVGESAADWLHRAHEKDIANVLYRYGDEKSSRKIAKAIVGARLEQKIETTTELAALIETVVPVYRSQKHPATKSFQAIRIFINNELGDLEQFLSDCLRVLKVGGRLCVMSFHSLEDRLVKQFMVRESKGEEFPPEIPIKASEIKAGCLKKINGLIRPDQQEIKDNVRARSARLRVAEKVR